MKEVFLLAAFGSPRRLLHLPVSYGSCSGHPPVAGYYDDSFIEAQYTEKLTIGWGCELPVAGHAMAKVTQRTTKTAIENNLVAGLILRVVRSWMRKGFHRGVYCEDGRNRLTIPFPVG